MQAKSKIPRIAGLCLILCIVWLISSDAVAQKSGDVVIVTTNGAELTSSRSGSTVVARIRAGVACSVLRAADDHLLVNVGADVGWLKSSVVLSPKRAFAHFTTKIKSDPRNATYVAARGLLLDAHFQKANLAVLSFSKAIKLDPNNPLYYSDRSIA